MTYLAVQLYSTSLLAFLLWEASIDTVLAGTVSELPFEDLDDFSHNPGYSTCKGEERVSHSHT